MELDALEQELVSLERHVGRVRARQMMLLAELDRNQVALSDGCRSMVEWTAGRLDVAPETASALVRTSRTADLAVAKALAAGEVTFDRAVELSRLSLSGVPNPIATGAGFDIAGLRRERSRRHRLSRQREIEVLHDRYVAMQPNLDRSSWRLWGELPGADGRIVERALGERADTFPSLPDGTRPPLGQRRADALTSIAQDSLTGTAGADTSTPLVTVFVDLDATTRTVTGATLDSGPSVGPGALEEILCNGRVETILTRGATPLAVGRRTRAIGPALRRAVLHRDGGSCTADGCTSRHRLEVHHIIPASSGGPTDPANLTTLCWFHHHVVIHGLGYRIDPDTPPHRRRFLSPDRHDPP
jgi:5-methylcytosine-specific restriction endonuclease McrA